MISAGICIPPVGWVRVRVRIRVSVGVGMGLLWSWDGATLALGMVLQWGWDGYYGVGMGLRLLLLQKELEGDISCWVSYA